MAEALARNMPMALGMPNKIPTIVRDFMPDNSTDIMNGIRDSPMVP